VSTRKATSIDAYLARVPAKERAALERLRKTIRSIVPEAQECISYSLKTLSADLGDYSQTKSSLHFESSAPLPATLVRKLIKARIEELEPRKTQPQSARARPRRRRSSD
jgi:uncharacterized protein YdhG (YjbR/CyaY superfamily)